MADKMRWVLVPLEPTEAMEKAFRDGFVAELHQPDKRRKRSAEAAGLRAMLKLCREVPGPLDQNTGALGVAMGDGGKP